MPSMSVNVRRGKLTRSCRGELLHAFRTINVQWIGQWGLFSRCSTSENQSVTRYQYPEYFDSRRLHQYPIYYQCFTSQITNCTIALFREETGAFLTPSTPSLVAIHVIRPASSWSSRTVKPQAAVVPRWPA